MDKQYKVVITKIGSPIARLTGAKALKALKSISLSEALDLIDNVPCIVHEGPKAEAEWLDSKLRQAGMDVTIEELLAEPESIEKEIGQKAFGEAKEVTGHAIKATEKEEINIFCRNCGKKLPKEADFCISCGVKLPKALARWSSVLSVRYLVSAMIALLSLLIIQLAVIPTLSEMLSDMAMALPALVLVMISANFRWAIALLAIVAMVLLIVKEIKIKQKRKCFFINLIFSVFTWVIVLIHVIVFLLLLFNGASAIV